MPRRPSDQDLREEFAFKVRNAIENRALTKKRAAAELGITRQSLYLYIKAKVAPGPDVLRKAMELWKIDLTYRGHRLTLEDLSARSFASATVLPVQMSLWDTLKRLDNRSVKVVIDDKSLQSLELKVSINF